jgi:hypothetical protein
VCRLWCKNARAGSTSKEILLDGVVGDDSNRLSNQTYLSPPGTKKRNAGKSSKNRRKIFKNREKKDRKRTNSQSKPSELITSRNEKENRGEKVPKTGKKNTSRRKNEGTLDTASL